MKTQRVKVSVIIPVYNPGIGIEKCIQCLKDQSLKEIEMIFIDDAGNDGSNNIIRNALKSDSRIRLIENPSNIGAGLSRNIGIMEAIGEYLSFVDPDDYISESFLELLYNKAEENHTDIVKGIYINVDEKGNVEKGYDPYELNNRIRKQVSAGKELFNIFTYQHTTALYRRELVLAAKALYGPSNFSEDAVFLLKVCYAAKTVETVDKAIYYYVSRLESGVRNFTINRLTGTYTSIREMLRFIDEKRIYSPDGYQYAITRILSLLNLQKYFEDNECSEASKKVLDEVREFVTSLHYCGELIKLDGIIDAFVNYNINLSVTPYGKKWRQVPYIEYERRINLWMSFLQEHPDYTWRCQYYLRQLFEHSIMYDNWTNRTEKKTKFNELRIQAKQLPDKKVLTDNYISMKCFVDYGIDLYNLRSTRIGKKIRSIKKIINKLGS